MSLIVLEDVRYKAYDPEKNRYSDEIVVGKVVVGNDHLMFFAHHTLNWLWSQMGFFFTPLIKKFGQKKVEGADDTAMQIANLAGAGNEAELVKMAESTMHSFVLKKSDLHQNSRIMMKMCMLVAGVQLYQFETKSMKDAKKIKEALGM